MITDTLDNEQTSIDSENYNFSDGDLTGFEEEFLQPKQDMDINEEPEDFDNDEFGEDSQQDPAAMARMAKNTAKFITRITDEGAALGLSLISKNPASAHKADPDSLKELERIITEYCKETGGQIPLWAQLVICLVTMYGFQVPQALHDRKINLEKERLENDRRQLERERKEFEEQKKVQTEHAGANE